MHKEMMTKLLVMRTVKTIEKMGKDMDSPEDEEVSDLGSSHQIETEHELSDDPPGDKIITKI